MNKSVIDPQINTVPQNEKCHAFVKKVRIVGKKHNVAFFCMCPLCERCRPSNETEANKMLFINQLGAASKFNWLETHLPLTASRD
jgi:hypothetical protein